MTDCKNCKYTDEYCASGDCTAQNDLTEQYKHGNLPDDRLYYYRFKGEPEVQITTQYGLYCEEADNKKEIEVIDFVPSYEEWKEKLRALDAAYETIKMEDETINRLVRSGKQCNCENAKLKELLKECVKMNTRLENALWQWNEESELYDENEALENKIDEVLNA